MSEEPKEPTTTCPECRSGKHANCDGGAWDLTEDKPAICVCWADNHHEGDV